VLRRRGTWGIVEGGEPGLGNELSNGAVGHPRFATFYALVVKPHPRIRKTVKWGCVTLAALFLVLEIASAKRPLLWSMGLDRKVVLKFGRLGVEWGPASRWDRQASKVLLQWSSKMYFDLGPKVWFNGPYRSVYLPLWGLSLISLAGAGAAWRLDVLVHRRALANPCPRCNYDQTGLAAGAVCPECGSKPP